MGNPQQIAKDTQDAGIDNAAVEQNLAPVAASVSLITPREPFLPFDEAPVSGPAWLAPFRSYQSSAPDRSSDASSGEPPTNTIGTVPDAP